MTVKTAEVTPVVLLSIVIAAILLWAFSLYQVKYGMNGVGDLVYGMISFFLGFGLFILSTILLLLIIIYELKNANSNKLIYSYIISMIPVAYIYVIEFL